MVVGEIGREPERQCEQARGLRRQLEARRIGTAHDQRERVERRILDAIDLQKGIEAAQLAVMRERLGAGDVIRRGASFLRDGEYTLGRGEQEFGRGIDKAPDQPWAGDAIDLRGCSRVTLICPTASRRVGGWESPVVPPGEAFHIHQIVSASALNRQSVSDDRPACLAAGQITDDNWPLCR